MNARKEPKRRHYCVTHRVRVSVVLCEELRSLSHCAVAGEHTEGAQLCALIEEKSRTRVSQIVAFQRALEGVVECDVLHLRVHVVVGLAASEMCFGEGRDHNVFSGFQTNVQNENENKKRQHILRPTHIADLRSDLGRSIYVCLQLQLQSCRINLQLRLAVSSLGNVTVYPSKKPTNL